MNNINRKKIEKKILNAISEIICNEVTNNMSLPTITEVELSNDMSHLKVYLSFMSFPKQSLDSLNKAKKFIRCRLIQDVNLRKAPSLHFVIDTTWENGRKIDLILNKIKNKG